MSDDDFTDEGEGIKNLRKQYEQTQKELNEARKQLDEFNKAKRTEALAEILKAKGVPASAAKLYNGEDVTEDAVGKWLADYADVFGGASSDSSSGNDANADAAARVSQASWGNSRQETHSADGGKVVGNPDEIKRLIDTQPYEELVKLGIMPASNLGMTRR